MTEATLDNFFVTVLDSDLRATATPDQRRAIRLTQSRLAIFVTDVDRGVPLAGLPLQVFVECDVRYANAASDATTYDELPTSVFSYRVPLGLLATDHVGYASFDLSRLPALIDLADVSSERVSATDQKTVDTLSQQQVLHTTIKSIWIHPYGDYAFDGLTPGVFAIRPDAIVVNAALTDGTARAMTASAGIPSMQEPSIVDWRLSPGSFAITPSLAVGEDECARLTPATGSLDTHYFHRVVLADGAPAPSTAAPAPTATIPATGPARLAPGVTHMTAPAAAPGAAAPRIGPLRVENAPGNTGGATPAAPAAQRLLNAAAIATEPPVHAVALMNLPDVRKGRIDVYRTDWYQLGHSLGKVLYSLALAPGENTDIAVIDWSREEVAGRTETTALTEAVLADLRRDRTIAETINGVLSEKQSGGSTMAAGSLLAGAAGSTGAMGAAGGLGFSLGGGSAWTSGERDMHLSTVQNLADRIQQSASAVRELQSSVVVSANQQEQNVLSTRNLTNYNHSHTLTVLYTQMLRHVRIVTAYDRSYDATLVRFPQLDVSRTDPTSLFKYLPFLRGSLMDPTLSPALDAYELFELETGRPDPQAQASADADRLVYGITGRIDVRPHVGTDGAKNAIGIGVVGVNGDVDIVGSTEIPVQAADGNNMNNVAAVETKFFFAIPWFGDHLFTGDHTSDDTYSQVNETGFTLLFSAPVRWGDLRYLKLQCVFQDTSMYRGFRLTPHPTAISDGAPIDLSQPLGDLDFQNLNDPDRTVTMPQGISSSITGSQAYLLKTPPAPPAARAPFDRLTQDQQRLVTRLLTHVVDNVQTYSAAYWADHEIERIHMIDALGTSFDASYYPVDTLGDYLVFPKLVSDQADVVGTVVDERLLTLPTPGVFVDARLGNCNVSEVIDNTRFWDWQQSPIPFRAPSITGITPQSQKTTPSGLEPTAMPAPIVGMQTAPAAPDPATAAALNALTRPDIFRDMSIAKEVADVIEQVTKSTAQVAQAAAGLVNAKGKTDGAQTKSATPTDTSTPVQAPSQGDQPTTTTDQQPTTSTQTPPAPVSTGDTGGGTTTTSTTTTPKLTSTPKPAPPTAKLASAPTNAGWFTVVLEKPAGFSGGLLGVEIRTPTDDLKYTSPLDQSMTVTYPAALGAQALPVQVFAGIIDGSDQLHFGGATAPTALNTIATIRARIPSKTVSITVSGKITGAAKLAAEAALQLKGSVDLKVGTLEQILSDKFGPTLEAGIDFGASTTISFEVVDPGKPLTITVEKVP